MCKDCDVYKNKGTNFCGTCGTKLKSGAIFIGANEIHIMSPKAHLSGSSTRPRFDSRKIINRGY